MCFIGWEKRRKWEERERKHIEKKNPENSSAQLQWWKKTKKSNGSLESVEINCIVSDFFFFFRCFSCALVAHSSLIYVCRFVRSIESNLKLHPSFEAPIKIAELIKFDNSINENGIGKMKMKLKIKCASEKTKKKSWIKCFNTTAIAIAAVAVAATVRISRTKEKKKWHATALRNVNTRLNVFIWKWNAIVLANTISEFLF